MDDWEICGWDLVTTQSARIMDKNNRVGFRLRNVEGTLLPRGKEMVRESLNWIDLDFEFTPEDHKFEYKTEVLG